MPSNAWTRQTPKSGSVTRAVLAERVYIANANTAFADPTTKLDGTTPAGWTDLGIVMNSQVQINYNKEIKYVETGLERVRRGSYITQKTAQATFTLEQFDMGVIEPISGLTKTTWAQGSKIHLGQEDIVSKAVLFYGSNKLDGKEYVMYCPTVDLTFQIQTNDDYRVLAVTAELFPFIPSGQSAEAFFSLYIVP